MIETIKFWFIDQHPIIQALIAGLFTWIVTAIGSGLVFFINSSNRKVLDISLGFTGGVMIAASFWSLLAPSIEYAEMQKELGLSNLPSWVAPTIGFFFGALFLFILDKVIPHLHLFEKKANAEGVNTKWQKTILLILAIALHNIPEGLAVGVAFGAIASPELLNVEIFTLGSAVALAIGIGIQNFPEGFAVIGAAIVLQVLPILPYALAFAAGAMIFIVVEEVIPESQKGGNTDLATMGLIAGFIVMMVLDVGLG
jgi:ZIP family zinc transporter